MIKIIDEDVDGGDDWGDIFESLGMNSMYSPSSMIYSKHLFLETCRLSDCELGGP
jgi:hypothetical protein